MMKQIKNIYISEYLLLTTLFIILPFSMQAQSNIRLSLQEIVNVLALDAPETQILRLNFENELLQFENYKKGFLPAVSISMSPVSFNRSIVKLQQATDGQYNYVEDYSSNSNAGISVQQKIPFTGGTLSAFSNLSYLNELSQSRHSFSSTPFAISYSQQLFGGGRSMRMEKTIEYKKNEENIKKYCIAVSGIQQKALSLFMDVFLVSLEKTVTSSNRQATDSLFSMAEVRYKNKRITESDFRQIELQAVNNEYLEENAAKNFEDAVRTLATFLGLLENYENAVVETPEFNLLLQIEPENAKYYIRKNNPAMLSREIRRLEAKKELYSAEIQNRFNASINLSYGMNKYAQTFSEVYSNPSQQQSVSVGFSIPFSLWGINRNNVLIAKTTTAPA
jgi:outer membrane protein TolC